MPRVISMSQAVACDSQAIAGAVENRLQESSGEMFVVLNSRTLYIVNYFRDMVDNIHQKRIWLPWNQCGSISLHLRRHIWNSCTSGASRHRDTRELPLEQRPNLHPSEYVSENDAKPVEMFWENYWTWIMINLGAQNDPDIGPLRQISNTPLK